MPLFLHMCVYQRSFTVNFFEARERLPLCLPLGVREGSQARHGSAEVPKDGLFLEFLGRLGCRWGGPWQERPVHARLILTDLRVHNSN